MEIQRLIGRALRSRLRLQALGERTLWLDCDVLQADGGTRCAAISGAYVAARRALDRFGLSKALTGQVAAVSVGVVDGRAAARPRLLGGLDRRDRHERRHDRGRPPRRGAGDRRARAVLARAARRAARPRRAVGSRRSWSPRTTRSPSSVPDLSTGEALLRLLLAAGLGGAIGLERELRDHEAGFRTHLLVVARRLRLHARLCVRLVGLDVLERERSRLRPDADRGADRDRDRLPRRRRDHRARHQRSRPDDGGDALGRRGDRDGGRHRLLRGRDRRCRARARLARAAQARQRTLRLARAAGGGGARDRARARR